MAQNIEELLDIIFLTNWAPMGPMTIRAGGEYVLAHYPTKEGGLSGDGNRFHFSFTACKAIWSPR